MFTFKRSVSAVRYLMRTSHTQTLLQRPPGKLNLRPMLYAYVTGHKIIDVLKMWLMVELLDAINQVL